MHRISTSAQMPRKGHKAANLPVNKRKLYIIINYKYQLNRLTNLFSVTLANMMRYDKFKDLYSKMLVFKAYIHTNSIQIYQFGDGQHVLEINVISNKSRLRMATMTFPRIFNKARVTHPSDANLPLTRTVVTSLAGVVVFPPQTLAAFRPMHLYSPLSSNVTLSSVRMALGTPLSSGLRMKRSVAFVSVTLAVDRRAPKLKTNCEPRQGWLLTKGPCQLWFGTHNAAGHRHLFTLHNGCI